MEHYTFKADIIMYCLFPTLVQLNSQKNFFQQNLEYVDCDSGRGVSPHPKGLFESYLYLIGILDPI